MNPGWVKIGAAAQYAGIRPRTLRAWLRQGLRHSCLPSGTILIKLAHLDEYLESFQVKKDVVEDLVEETLREMEK